MGEHNFTLLFEPGRRVENEIGEIVRIEKSRGWSFRPSRVETDQNHLGFGAKFTGHLVQAPMGGMAIVAVRAVRDHDVGRMKSEKPREFSRALPFLRRSWFRIGC